MMLESLTVLVACDGPMTPNCSRVTKVERDGPRRKVWPVYVVSMAEGDPSAAHIHEERGGPARHLRWRPVCVVVAAGAKRCPSHRQEAAFGLYRCKVGGAPIGEGSFGGSPKASQQIGPGRVE